MTDLLTIDYLRDYLLVGAALFALGMLGFLSRRNLIVMFLSAEMMLQGTALSLIALSRFHGNWNGQIFTIVILTIAASEAAIALALIMVLYDRRASLDITLWHELREEAAPAVTPALEEAATAEVVEAIEGPETYPHLTPAGIEPEHPVQPWTERRR